MAFEDDFETDISGNITHTSGTTNYPVIDLHRYLGALADDAQASGDDLVDIATQTPSARSTDQIIDLLGPFNIDDTAAQFLYGGSIRQGTGDKPTVGFCTGIQGYSHKEIKNESGKINLYVVIVLAATEMIIAKAGLEKNRESFEEIRLMNGRLMKSGST